MQTPQFSYRFGNDATAPIPTFGPASRLIEHHGRTGIHFGSVHGRGALPEHTVNEPQGAFSMWMMSLDDLSPATQHPQHAKSNPHFSKHVLMTDREAVGDTDAACFCLVWECYWHPVFYAKFAQGSHLDNAWKDRGAEVLTGHFHFHRLEWYLVTVCWNTPANQYAIYANGILVGTADNTTPNLPRQTCGPVMYIGSPRLVISEIQFFDHTLEASEIKQQFQAGCTAPNEDRQCELKKTFGGADLPKLDWHPDSSWTTKLDLSLRERAQFHQFFVQGDNTCVHFDDDGFRIQTPGMQAYMTPQHTVRPGVDMTRMYLWTRDTFEGDLHVSFDFKLNARGGLCLLMTQAAGMQGEDFLEDYPLRVNGSMGTVCWEDVRNYHWEFFRDIVDVPNHHVSHACLKNPWFKPMSFQMEDRHWQLDRWHRLDYLQEGARIRGAIDGVVVMDVTDNAFDNNGPILLNGRIALRCMMRTDMTFRNLRVLNREIFKVL